MKLTVATQLFALMQGQTDFRISRDFSAYMRSRQYQ